MSELHKKIWNKQHGQRARKRHLQFAERVVKHVQGIGNKTLLEIGCGDGQDAVYFNAKGFIVTAIDFSEEAIQRLKSANSAVNAQIIDIQKMQFAAESFDVVYSHLSLHYFNDEETQAIFDQVYSQLKPGGYFFVKCKSVHDPLYGLGDLVDVDTYCVEYNRHFFSKDYMQQKLHMFTLVDLQETQDSYDGHESAFIEAVARK